MLNRFPDSQVSTLTAGGRTELRSIRSAHGESSTRHPSLQLLTSSARGRRTKKTFSTGDAEKLRRQLAQAVVTGGRALRRGCRSLLTRHGSSPIFI